MAMSEIWEDLLFAITSGSTVALGGAVAIIRTLIRDVFVAIQHLHMHRSRGSSLTQQWRPSIYLHCHQPLEQYSKAETPGLMTTQPESRTETLASAGAIRTIFTELAGPRGKGVEERMKEVVRDDKKADQDLSRGYEAIGYVSEVVVDLALEVFIKGSLKVL
ncbi:hypothetical protein E4U53_006479 [Claviceps sorghi]|nr:hypothetical protein E4U53_006479 [Claviceps sorghi]